MNKEYHLLKNDECHSFISNCVHGINMVSTKMSEFSVIDAIFVLTLFRILQDLLVHITGGRKK